MAANDRPAVYEEAKRLLPNLQFKKIETLNKPPKEIKNGEDEQGSNNS